MLVCLFRKGFRQIFHEVALRNRATAPKINFIRAPCANVHTSRCVRNEKEKDKVYYDPSKYSSYDTFIQGNVEAWKYQPVVVAISLAAFLIYFCILREENHLDLVIGETLVEVLPEMEEGLIISKIKENRILGLDTADLEKRLKEIKEAKEGIV